MRIDRLRPALLLVAVLAALAISADQVARHTIHVVQASGMLPRWDLATHLGHGWVDYWLLTTGRIPQLLWDLWHQGYWPPLLSVWQVPFYALWDGGMAGGLWSAVAAFVLAGVAGCAALWTWPRGTAALPAGIFIALLTSSPFILAYAAVPMTEMLAAGMQLLVVLTYAQYRSDPAASTARRVAIALTLLFFTKYNYFLLLAVPLLIHEGLERTAGWRAARRLRALWTLAKRLLVSPTAVLLALYFAALILVLRTGGFEAHVAGQRISVRSIGSSGHVVLYLLLARLAYLHARGRIDWAHWTSTDPLLRQLLLWFALPVTLWIATPYPNHLRDVFNLLHNRRVGEASDAAGLLTYLDAIRTTYFYSEWTMGLAVAGFVVAAARYRQQPPHVRLLLLAVPLQLVAIAGHHTRLPRFLLPTIVLLCLAAASDAARWIPASRRGRLADALLAMLLLAAGTAASARIVTEDRFRAIAFENYTDDDALRAALETLRGELQVDDRLAIVGESNELSPALFRWELGPPSGLPCLPFQLGGSRGIDVGLASHVLLLEPRSSDRPTLDITSYYAAQRRIVEDRIEAGALRIVRELDVPSLDVGFRLFKRTDPAALVAACRRF